ncbi:MAG: hypothetical protein ACE15C_18550 [Phycisphaerae bacterium]
MSSTFPRRKTFTGAAVTAIVLAAWLGQCLAQEKAPSPTPPPAPAAPEGMLRFAFGPIKPRSLEGVATMRGGFTPVTVASDYAKDKGFGWVGAEGEVKTDWLELRGKLNARSRPGPNDLLNSWIAGGLPFQVDVPNGKYTVTTCMGDWGEYEFFPFGSFTLLYQGKEVFKSVHNRDNLDQWLYKHKYDDYERGEKLYDRYVKSRFDVVTQEVEAADGKITIQARQDAGPNQYTGAINYVVISPAAAKDDHARFLAGLEAMMRFAFDKRFPLMPVKEAYCDNVTDEEKAANFVVIRTDGQKIYPWQHASRQNHLNELHAYAAWGQFEAVDFAVIPLKNLASMTCTVSDLEGPAGAKIPASEIKVGYVKYWEWYNRDTRNVTIEPMLVMDRNVIPKLENRTTRQWWLTLHVPDKAAGGAYKGTVTVTAEGGTIKVPLTLDVVPVKLDGPGGVMLLNYSSPWEAIYYGDEAARWADIEKELVFQRDHGMNSVAWGARLPIKDDDVSNWEKTLDLYKKVGFDQPFYFASTMNMYGQFRNLLDPAQQDEYCNVLKKLDAVAKKKGVPVIYSLCDETTNDGREALAMLVAKFTREKIPDIKTIGDINGYRELMGSAPNLYAAGFNNGWGGSYGTNRQDHQLITRTIIDRVKSVGCEPWFVNGGVGRYPFGIFFWKMESIGVKGKCEWHYYCATSDPYNPFDSQELNAFGSLVFPSCIPTLLIEHSREGIDDLKYVRTLQRMVAEMSGKDAKPSPQTAARVQVAKEALDYWMDLMPDRMVTGRTPDGAVAAGSGADFPPARLDAFRKEIAWHICRLAGVKDCPAVYPPQTMLASWEQGESTGWTTKIQPVAEHATDGKQSGKMVFDKANSYFDAWGRMRVKDWRGYSSFRFDIFNAQDKEVDLLLVLRDQLASNVNAEASARKTVSIKLKSGANQIVVPLVGIADDGGKRPLDLSCMFNAYFALKDGAEGTTLFVDNMRLVEDQ